MTDTTNRPAIVEADQATYALHVGIAPVDGPATLRLDPHQEYEEIDHRVHRDPATEVLFWQGPGVTAYVSGSWKCWGPADQPTEGDNTLHVVLYDTAPMRAGRVHMFLVALAGDIVSGRLIDWAAITDAQDWSEWTHTALINDSGDVSIYEVGRRVG